LTDRSCVEIVCESSIVGSEELATEDCLVVTGYRLIQVSHIKNARLRSIRIVSYSSCEALKGYDQVRCRVLLEPNLKAECPERICIVTTWLNTDAFASKVVITREGRLCN